MKNIVLLAFFAVSGIFFSQNKTYELSSPKGKNKIKFELVNNAPKYAVSHGKTQVISPSDMGFLLKNNEDLSQNFEILKVENSTFDETWDQVWGEKKKIRNHYNQMVVKLQQKNQNKRKLDIQFTNLAHNIDNLIISEAENEGENYEVTIRTLEMIITILEKEK